MTHKSQTDTIIRHMEIRGGITTWAAFKLYRITRLSGRIYDAKRRGKRIDRVAMKRNGKRFVSYRLAA